MSSQTSSTRRIALALSGGAARGIAHVGVLRALVENDIPIAAVAGTSAGALVGGAFASGLTIDEIEDIGHGMRWRHVGRPTLSRFGLQSNARMEKYLHDRFPITRFEDLPIPFAAVATDLKSHDAVVMRDKGDVAFAIRASCTIPFVYAPCRDAEGRQLVDGGLVALIPVKAARELGADLVIAVDVNAEGATFLGPPRTTFGIILQSMLTLQKTVSQAQLQTADVVIKPHIGHIRWDQLSRSKELLKAGYEAGLESIERIRKLLATPPFDEPSGMTALSEVSEVSTTS
jgi:NTE family protein